MFCVLLGQDSRRAFTGQMVLWFHTSGWKIYKIHKYAKLELNIPCGSRVMSIFTKRARPAKMMLGEASAPYFIPVARQCLTMYSKNRRTRN